MKSYQVEILSVFNGQQIYTCSMIAASSQKSALSKAIKASKKSGAIDQRHIQTFCVNDYAEALPF